MDSKTLAKKIAAIADKLKGSDIKILDLEKLSSFTDFFVIASASSNRQTRAIADKIFEELKKEEIRPHSFEGYNEGNWILIDFVDVVVHIFLDEIRAHYDLEGFWTKAKKVPLRIKKSETKTSSRRKTKRPKSPRKN